jgi:branched-chain amino acid transport system ATP-binding protein
MTEKKLALSLIDLRVAYGKAQALHDVSLDVAAGEVIALLGSNGAGKTTTLRTISGLLKPTGGDILFEGRSIRGRPPDEIIRMGIAHSPEERHVWPEMTVHENLQLGAYICQDRREIETRVAKVVQRFPRLRERFSQLAGTLSGGEQQMLAIGRALMSEPKLLLLDEPSLGLSPRMSDEVLRVIISLRDQGITVVLVEQNVHNALSVADRAYVFETGRIVAQDTAAAILENPEVLKAYLGA